eukprot:TRINITY_DN6515_c0_g1_i2.p1 TRINITY_DN6515_c0_g1~~TRINITY_DN6515_c0_g1_i2.p1  ORF type:complete len:131 (-),score=21.22 TRINITY_DN6515_c0_g1_i2:18-410(-)
MPKSVLPFLMFQGDGQQALAFYQSVFTDAKVEVELHDGNAGAPKGTLKMARMTIAGNTIIINDSPIKHAFNFTPSISLFVECSSEDEVRKLSEALKQDGSEMMPAGNYGFSTLFAWVSDKYGVSWQLNFP